VAHHTAFYSAGRSSGNRSRTLWNLSSGSGSPEVNEFSALWRKSAAASLSLSLVFVLVGLLFAGGKIVFWSLAAGIIPGVVDLVGLGLRLPLWARLNGRAAVASINLRLLSRLVLLGVFFYALQHFTDLDLGWALAGIFLPYVVYLTGAIWGLRHKGVNG
jgi:hypothetical protein